MDEQNRASEIRLWALEEGFDRVGVARLTPSEHGEFLRRWLDRGDQGEMRYLQRRSEVRLDPRRVLPGARSALCVARQYSPLQGQETPPGDLWPGVARYARGEDYHHFMEKGLKRLASRIEEAFPQTRSRVYVDTGPVLERELAARAGLGSVGKNTNLLDGELGSWFLLGEIILTLDLEPDTPGSDLCGTCTECLDSCPTEALREPYHLDSRLCISYWTIEHRGSIPTAMRAELGSWIFGCDICQEVCPINAGVASVDHAEFRMPEHRSQLDLAGLLRLEPSEYAERFRGSPMKRAKLAGLQRNAVIAMGNSGSSRYLEALIEALEAGQPTVRGHAAWALGRIRDARSRDALAGALARECEPAVREEIRAALQATGD